MVKGATYSLLVLLLCAQCAEALDAKWTPNGEAPAPFSTKARQQMGMDPAAMAGAAAATAVAPGAAFKFNLFALLVMYLCNNWKVVMAFQEVAGTLLQPLFGAMETKKQQAEAAAKLKAAADARAARLSRLKAQGSAAKNRASSMADDDEEDEQD